MKLAFIYSGQGAQVPAMARDLYENFSSVRDFYDEIGEVRDISFYSDLEELTKTENTQPVMVAFQLAVTDLLRDRGIEASSVAGLSIGEYSALYAAGVISRADAMKIASFRGKRMAHYSEKVDTSMLAVLGVEEGELEELLSRESLAEEIFISNINTRGQIVVTGEKSAIKKLEPLLKEKRLRALPLRVSGPFHTPYMEPVAGELREFFKDIYFKKPRIKIAMNLTGDFEEENFEEIMSRQVMERVRFKDDLERLLASVDALVEIGHNRVLAGFVKRLDPKKKVYEIRDYKSLMAFVEEQCEN